MFPGRFRLLNGKLVEGNIVAQAHQAIRNLLAILKEASYGPEHLVRCISRPTNQ
jgi:enamine deaminase RidA (YjgF/YER057c/UK114 family)